MKKFLLLLLISTILTGCTNTNTEPKVQINTPPSKEKKIQTNSLKDSPCQKIPDGSLTGECPIDEFGNPYIPKESNDDHYDNPNDEPHLHSNDHEHSNDTPPHRH